MSYRTIDELPADVRRALPEHGQRIYLQAYNHAWEQHAWEADEDPQGTRRAEESHELAWSAVRQEYDRRGDRWTRREAE